MAFSKIGFWGMMFFPMFNKNNRTVYMLQFISLYNSSKTFHIPYLYTYTTRIAQKLVRGQYHLPGETTHRTNTQISHSLKNMSDMVLGQLTVYCIKMADGCLDLRLVSPGSNWHPVYKTLHNISQQMCIRL